MSNNELDINGWDPDFDDGKPVVWAAEWLGPEEKIEDEVELNSVYMQMKYRGVRTYHWYYFQVKAAMDDLGLDKFLEQQGILDATAEEVQELREFFEHWLMFINCDIDLEGQKEFEVGEESLGDDDIGYLEAELEEAGFKKNTIMQEVKRTLH